MDEHNYDTRYYLMVNFQQMTIPSWSNLLIDRDNVHDVEWFPNNLITISEYTDKVYLVDPFSELSSHFKNKISRLFYILKDNVINLFSKMTDPTNSLSVKKIMDDFYLIYLHKDVASFNIDIQTIDDKPYYSSNTNSMILFDLKHLMVNEMLTDKSGGSIIETMNGMIFETVNKIYIFNNKSGALKHFKFTGVNSYVSDYQNGMKQLYQKLKST